MQIVENAIDRSKSHNDLVVITSDQIAADLGNEPHTVEEHRAAVHAELYDACDDWTSYSDQEHTTTSEYWGTDEIGREWRVHVRIEVPR